MKKLILSFTIALALQASTGYAQTSLSTADAIIAGSENVKGSLDQAILKLETQRNVVGFHASDYWSQLAGFKQQYTEAFSDFQKGVGDEKQGILAKLSFFMDAYNKAYLSTDDTAEEKKNKLSVAKKQLDDWTAQLNIEYQQLILKTMFQVFDYQVEYLSLSSEQANLNYFLKFSQDEFNCVDYNSNSAQTTEILYLQQKTEQPRKRNKSNSSPDYQNIAAFCVNTRDTGDHKFEQSVKFGTFTMSLANGSTLFKDPHYVSSSDNYCCNEISYSVDRNFSNLNLNELKNGIFSPYTDVYENIIAKGCTTKICLSLRGSDLATLATLFKSNVDRDLTLSLADKTPVTLKAANVYLEAAIKMFVRADYPNPPVDFDTKN